jgi:hypothetical protein
VSFQVTVFGPEWTDRTKRLLARAPGDVPFYLQDFTDRYEGRYRDVQLPLPIRLA